MVYHYYRPLLEPRASQIWFIWIMFFVLNKLCILNLVEAPLHKYRTLTYLQWPCSFGDVRSIRFCGTANEVSLVIIQHLLPGIFFLLCMLVRWVGFHSRCAHLGHDSPGLHCYLQTRLLFASRADVRMGAAAVIVHDQLTQPRSRGNFLQPVSSRAVS